MRNTPQIYTFYELCKIEIGKVVLIISSVYTKIWNHSIFGHFALPHVSKKQDRRCRYNVTLWRVCANTVAVKE